MKRIPFQIKRTNQFQITIPKSDKVESSIKEFYREPRRYHFKFIKKALA